MDGREIHVDALHQVMIGVYWLIAYNDWIYDLWMIYLFRSSCVRWLVLPHLTIDQSPPIQKSLYLFKNQFIIVGGPFLHPPNIESSSPNMGPQFMYISCSLLLLKTHVPF